MATFRQLLLGNPEDLVRMFYNIRIPQEKGFIAKLDAAANMLNLNHSQLVCGLGFNRRIFDLPDVLSVVGFASEKALTIRRDELFRTDMYQQLSLDDIIDVYSHHLPKEEQLQQMRALVAARLSNIENALASESSLNAVSYKMELHAFYNSALADEDFVFERWHNKNRAVDEASGIQKDELRMIIDNNIVPAGNLFFSDELSPAEKLILIESGEINISMIKNRMQNTEISPAEREMLEDNLRLS